MSTDSSVNIAAYENWFASRYSFYATLALVGYEHLMTFKHEAEYLQLRRKSAATWIFVANRYLLIMSIVAQSVPIGSQTCGNGKAMNLVSFLSTGPLTGLPSAIFSVLRVFVLLRDWPYRNYVVGFLAAKTIFLFVAITWFCVSILWVYVFDPILGPSCVEAGVTVSISVAQHLELAASIAGIVGQGVVLIVTWINTFNQVRQAASLGTPMPWSRTLLLDGSLFFGSVMAMDIILALPDFHDTTIGTTYAYNVIAPLVAILPNVMLSRFIINLRQIDTVSSDMFAEVTNERTPHFSDANFRMPSFGSILDNLGEPIAPREEDSQNVETDIASTTNEFDKRSEPSKASP